VAFNRPHPSGLKNHSYLTIYSFNSLQISTTPFHYGCLQPCQISKQTKKGMAFNRPHPSGLGKNSYLENHSFNFPQILETHFPKGCQLPCKISEPSVEGLAFHVLHPCHNIAASQYQTSSTNTLEISGINAKKIRIGFHKYHAS